MFDTIPWQGAYACLLAVSWQQQASGGTYQPRGSPKAALPLTPSVRDFCLCWQIYLRGAFQAAAPLSPRCLRTSKKMSREALPRSRPLPQDCWELFLW